MNNRIRLVADSTVDLPAELIRRWNIAIVPAFINFGNQSYPDDGVALPRSEFYRRLTTSSELPTTSAPSPGVAADVLQSALNGYEQVVAFTVASQLSSIYNTVRLAADQVDSQRIIVYDSGSVSMGLGWQVVAAAEALERGASADEVLAAARDVRSRLEVWAIPDTMEYLRRGGRVNAVVAGIGTLLNIKPIILLKEGTVRPIQRVRSMNKAIQAVCELARECAPLERLALLHTNYSAGAETLRELLGDIAPAGPYSTVIADVNTGVGTHFGPNSLGVALVRARR